MFITMFGDTPWVHNKASGISLVSKKVVSIKCKKKRVFVTFDPQNGQRVTLIFTHLMKIHARYHFQSVNYLILMEISRRDYNMTAVVRKQFPKQSQHLFQRTKLIRDLQN